MPAFDKSQLLERVDNDVAFLAETVQMLGTDGRALMAELRAAIGAGDSTAVGRTAHSLKGAISNFCAPGAHAAALDIERMGKAGNLTGAGQAADDLNGKLETLISELEKFVQVAGSGAGEAA